MKIATLSTPRVGGIFSITRQLRTEIENRGGSLTWIGTGSAGKLAWEDARFQHEHQNGVVIGSGSDKENAAKVVEFLVENEYDAIIIDVYGGDFVSNIARYIPATIKKIVFVHSISLQTYESALIVKDYASYTICVSNRIYNDLVSKYDFDPNFTSVVPNGTKVKQNYVNLRSRSKNSLKVVYFGRIDNSSKRVFDLPKIFSKLDDVTIFLTVIGEGPDEGELAHKLAEANIPVEFLPSVTSEMVPETLSSYDALILPSQFEGFGLVLIEAMAAGCIPISSRIRGVTDMIIEHGTSGFLFPVGNTDLAASHIRSIFSNPNLREMMMEQAQQRVTDHFDVNNTASMAVDKIERAMTFAQKVPSLNLSEWTYDISFQTKLRRLMPDGLKSIIKNQYYKYKSK